VEKRKEDCKINHRKYRYLLTEMINAKAEYVDRDYLFERVDIPQNHYHNVTNPDRKTSCKKKDKPYYIPLEWILKMTIGFSDFRIIKEIAADCGCICITPDEIEELRSVEPADRDKVMATMNKIVGLTDGNENGD